MKFKNLKFLILILFFFPQYSLSYNKSEYFLYCNQIPEGSPFGLIFKDNVVAQIGIVNFEKVLDYKENFQKKGNYYIWYNVSFNTKTLKLHIGNQKEHFAECKKLDDSLELNKLLELFLINKKNETTI
tara:strand:+ start:167 stop:550 length:384 start_codon:yes stop_codon:yes gene_type:complete